MRSFYLWVVPEKPALRALMGPIRISKLGGGVQPASQNPHFIYDLGFALPYLWMHVQYAVVADVGSSVFAGMPFLLYSGHLGTDQFLDEEKLAQQRAILLFATHLQQHFVVLKVAQQCHQMQMKCERRQLHKIPMGPAGYTIKWLCENVVIGSANIYMYIVALLTLPDAPQLDAVNVESLY